MQPVHSPILDVDATSRQGARLTRRDGLAWGLAACAMGLMGGTAKHNPFQRRPTKPRRHRFLRWAQC